jgi:magnesium chelatase subunit H
MTSKDRDSRVLALFEQVLEIEERLIPTGLHVFGSVDAERSIVDMLRMVASFDRPEQGVRALTDLVAEGLDFPDYSTLLKNSVSNESSLREREQVESLVRRAVELFVK